MERLQKFLARAGVASRRKCEALIDEGRVQVNGQIVRHQGLKVDPAKDLITVNNRRIDLQEPEVYFLLYKPTGVVTTAKDPQGRKTVLDLLPGIQQRIYPVGRLDYDTSGLLLLTNDGELTNALIHPRHEVGKIYQALVKGLCSQVTVEQLRKGVYLSDGATSPARVKVLKRFNNSTLLELTIHEGRNRQVRRMCDCVGHPVLKLKRTGFGPLTLQGMKSGHYRQLSQTEIDQLKSITE